VLVGRITDTITIGGQQVYLPAQRPDDPAEPRKVCALGVLHGSRVIVERWFRACSRSNARRRIHLSDHSDRQRDCIGSG
jgi:hypothetical protein